MISRVSSSHFRSVKASEIWPFIHVMLVQRSARGLWLEKEAVFFVVLWCLELFGSVQIRVMCPCSVKTKNYYKQHGG